MVAPPFPNYKDGDDNDDGDTAVGSCENTDSARQKKRESGIEQFSAKEIFSIFCNCNSSIVIVYMLIGKKIPHRSTKYIDGWVKTFQL